MTKLSSRSGRRTRPAAAATGLLVWLLAALAHAQPADPQPTPADPPEAAPAPAPEAAPAPAPVAGAAETTKRPIASDGWSLSGGRASFPLVDDLDPLVIEAHLTVFAQYVLSLRTESDETEWFHDFELTRGHARLDASFEEARARVMVEAVRSASEGALLGVAGDSFVLRMREAWGSYTAWDIVEARVGLLPTMTIGPIEQIWGMRMVAPTAIERAGLMSPADLGITLRGILPLELGWVGVGAYNGEGYDRRELNRGKNIEVAAQVHPLATVEGAGPVVVGGSYVSGSTGTGLARADRITANLGWEGDMIRGGAAFTYAIGVESDSDRNGMLVEGFVRVRPIERLVIGAEAFSFFRNTDDFDDRIVTITGAVGYFFLDPIGAFLAVDGILPGETAEQTLPGQDDVRLRVIGAVDF